MNNILLLKLFSVFVKIGAILLGGGYVILPILINEFVEKRKLIEHDELINYFALSSTATAQATVIPTIGLLPAPKRPIIST